MPEQPRGRDVGELGGYGGGGTADTVRVPRPTEAWTERYLFGSVQREQRSFRAFAAQMREIQARVAKAGKRALRGLHAKMIAGTTDATLHVRAPALSGGYLLDGRSYPVTVRFSSASSRPQPDPTRDLRGIALRIHTDRGDCDLLLTNAEVSHVRDADEFMRFMRAMSHGRVSGAVRLLLDPRVRAVAMFRRLAKQTSEPRRSLAHEAFFSRAPFLLGGIPVRYKLEPQQPGDRTALGSGSDLLFDDLRVRLRGGALRWVLYAQPYEREATTPLEDSAAPWQSALYPIATLEIPQQELPAPSSEPWRIVDALRFNPWHTLPEMRPLGSLNRARRFVYAASQEERARRTVPSPLSARYRAVYELLHAGFPLLNRMVPWDELPPRIGVFNLIALRERFRRESLFDADDPCEAAPLPRPTPETLSDRTCDGAFNDLVRPAMGAAGRRLGRNTPPEQLRIEDGDALRTPDPKVVSERLLARRAFVPAPTLNLLAVAWIQFQTHDWFVHREIEPSEPARSAREQMAKRLGVRVTALADKGSPLDQALPPIHENAQTHWWDCSHVYGHDAATTARLRGPAASAGPGP